MTSIRNRLLKSLLGVILLTLTVGLGGVYLAARGALFRQFDDALQVKARAISTLTRWTADGIQLDFSDRFLPGFEDSRPRDFFVVRDAQGREIARSESLLPGQRLPSLDGTLDRPGLANFTLPDGRPGRGIGYRFPPVSVGPAAPVADELAPQVQIVVASDRDSLDDALEALGWIYGGMTVLLVGLTVWAVPSLLKRGLRPLNQLGEQASRIDAGSLAFRFGTDDLPAELRPIVVRWNDLLARLEQSFARERRFSADLAHEFRVPLAELRTMAECALRWPEARDPEFEKDSLAIARQMERIVVQLLALARAEKGQQGAKPERIQLPPLVETCWRPFAKRAAERGLKVDLDLGETDGLADPGLLRSIVTNLCENAVDYASAGGSLSLSVGCETGKAVIRVANDAGELGEEDVPHLFERLWRKDAARSGDGHAGIGLSLAREFAQAMGWSLTAQWEKEGRLVMALEGPVASGSESATIQPSIETARV